MLNATRRNHHTGLVRTIYQASCNTLDVNCPWTGSCVWTLGWQQVALFRKVVESVGSGAQLKEVGHWGGPWCFIVWPYFLFLPIWWMATESRQLPCASTTVEPLVAMSSPPWQTAVSDLSARKCLSSLSCFVRYLLTVLRKNTWYTPHAISELQADATSLFSHRSQIFFFFRGPGNSSS